MKNLSSARQLINSLNFDLVVKIAISGPLKAEKYHKIVITPFENKSQLFQAACYYESKVNHKNFSTAAALKAYLDELLAGYKQFDIILTKENIKLLANNSQLKIIRQATPERKVSANLHNKTKNYILAEGSNIAWLNQLGITSKNGQVLAAGQKKFRQINHFLEIIAHIADHIPQNAQIVDAACGKSVLSFALYYYLNDILQKNISITALDLKKDVIANCQALADSLGFARLKFKVADLSTWAPETKVDCLVSLHACDTATDYALYSGLKWGCKVILAAPCCQQEANQQISNDALKPLLKHGILKERFAALLTDALRAELLAAWSYKTSVMEFIESEHTPKNILIRAIKRENNATDTKKHLAQYQTLAQEYNLEPMLYRLLYSQTILE